MKAYVCTADNVINKTCVMDENKPHDCTLAKIFAIEGKTKNVCMYWKEVEFCDHCGQVLGGTE